MSPTAPILLHLSPASFHSLLATFLSSLSSLARLDAFIKLTSHRTSSSSLSPNPTTEAFAEAVAHALQTYRRWCVTQEQAILHPSETTVISLLRLSHEVELRSTSLRKLVDAVETVSTANRHPCQTTTALLDYLLAEGDLAFEVGDAVGAGQLQDVFLRAVEPLWRLLGDWVRKGRLGTGAPNDFFVQRNTEMELDDPDFFWDGFEVWRCEGGEGEDGRRRSVPRMLEGIAGEVLGCGKVVHVLRTLAPDQEWLDDAMEWPSLAELLVGPTHEKASSGMAKNDSALDPTEVVRQALFASHVPILALVVRAAEPPSSTSFPPFSQSVKDAIAELCKPLFRVVHQKLHRVFLDDCQLQYHITAIQGVFLMRKGWEIGSFLGGLFEKVRCGFLFSERLLTGVNADGSRTRLVGLPAAQLDMGQSCRTGKLDGRDARPVPRRVGEELAKHASLRQRLFQLAGRVLGPFPASLHLSASTFAATSGRVDLTKSLCRKIGRAHV